MAQQQPSKARRTAAGITAVLLVGVGVVGSFVGAKVDGDHLTKPAYEALAAAGLHGVTAEFNGREAKLTGSAADKDVAITAVQDVYGVRWATFEEGAGSPSGDVSLPSLDISSLAPGTTLSGLVPSEGIKASIAAGAEKVFGAPVRNNLDVDPSISTPDWLTGLTDALPQFPTIRGGSLSLGEKSIDITGTVADEASIKGLESLLAAKLPTLTANVDLAVEGSTASASPSAAAIEPSIAVATSDTGVTVTGTVPSQEDADAIGVQMTRIYSPLPVTNSLTIDPDTVGSSWFDSFKELLPQLPQIAGGAFEVDGEGLSLSGEVADAATIDAVTSLVNGVRTLPEPSLSLTAATAAPTRPDPQPGAFAPTTVLFPTSAAGLTPEAMAALDAVAESLRANPSLQLELDGYVSLPHNGDQIAFSAARAQSVADYLVAGGIDPARLTVVGQGSANPVGDNNTLEGRLANQRVELSVKGN